MSVLSNRPGYRPDIQGLRGVAVLLVVIFHAGLPLYGGYVGVDVFFVISGFVITRGIVRNLEREKFSFIDFYIKRMRRLLPALSVMLAITLLLTPWLGPIAGFRLAERTGVAAALFNANHYLMLGRGYFDASSDFNPFLHTWSLSLEEQFYFLFPATLFLLHKLGRRTNAPRRIIVGLLILSALSFAACIYYSYFGSLWIFSGQKVAFYTILTRAWQFAVGALLALLGARIAKTFWSNSWWIAIGLLMILTASVLYNDSTVFPGFAALLPTLGAMLVITGGMTPSTSIAYQWLSSKPMVRIGDLSYSWYLWHWPMIVFAAAMFPKTPLIATLCAGVLSYPAAILSERLVENPIRFRRREHWSPALVMLAVCIVTPVLAWGGMTFQINLLLKDVTKTPLVRRVIQSEHKYRSIPCEGLETPGNPKTGCQWSAIEPRFDVYLVGDSNARQWIPMLKQLVPEVGGRLTATTLSACPLLPIKPYESDAFSEECYKWSQQVLTDIRHQRPEIVIIANAFDMYLSDPRWGFHDGAKIVSQSKEKEKIYTTQLVRLRDDLAERGTYIVYVEPIPKFTRSRNVSEQWFIMANRRYESAMVRRCSVLALSTIPQSCNSTRSAYSEHWVDTSATRDMFSALMLEEGNTVRLDGLYCPDGQCVSLTSDFSKIIYYDTNHLAEDGAKMAREVFQTQLRIFWDRF